MNVKQNWMAYAGALLLAGALFIGGFIIGRSAGASDVNVALARYNELRTADDALVGRLGSTLGGALERSKQLSLAGNGLEQSAHAVAVLANSIHDAISAIARYEEARGSSGPGSGEGGDKP